MIYDFETYGYLFFLSNIFHQTNETKAIRMWYNDTPFIKKKTIFVFYVQFCFTVLCCVHRVKIKLPVSKECKLELGKI